MQDTIYKGKIGNIIMRAFGTMIESMNMSDSNCNMTLEGYFYGKQIQSDR